MNNRRDRLMELQQQVVFDYNQQQVGKQLDVLIDQQVPEEPNVWVGRSTAIQPVSRCGDDEQDKCSPEEMQADRNKHCNGQCQANHRNDIWNIPYDGVRLCQLGCVHGDL